MRRDALVAARPRDAVPRGNAHAAGEPRRQAVLGRAEAWERTVDIFEASPWRHAERDPERLAISMADTGESLTYGAMIAGANRLARLFIRLGLNEGDTVAYFLENQPRYLEAVWGAKIAGLYYVCISRQLNAADVAYILENSQAKAFVASYALSGVASDAVERLKTF